MTKDSLDTHVTKLHYEAVRGTITSKRAYRARQDSIDTIQNDTDNIIRASSMSTVLLPFLAEHLSEDGDKYAQQSALLAEQFGAKEYWQGRANNPSMTYYLTDDHSVDSKGLQTNVTTVVRRGLDSLFISGMLKPHMKEGALDESYYRAVGKYSLAEAAKWNEMYESLARNFDQVTNRLRAASSDMFEDRSNPPGDIGLDKT